MKLTEKNNKRLAGVKDFNLFLEPIITEKSSMISQSGSRVVFKVPVSASKTDIKNAVERVFGVKVEAVKTLNILGKTKRTARGISKRQNVKKAYITLPKGQSISVVEGL